MQNHSILVLFISGMILVSCGSMEPVSQVRDDVYYSPGMVPVMAGDGTAAEGAPMVDDYYNSGDAQEFNGTRGYYDMTYNDPYYYNYDRFGLGNGSSGWNSAWSVSLGYGYGSGCMGNSMSMSYGWGSAWGYRGSPWGYDPWYGYPSWGMGMNMGMGMYGGCGYGPYYGPWGSCYNCYAPIVVCGSSNAVIAHRPTLGSGGGGIPSDGNGATRMVLRDPVGLDPLRREVARQFNTGASINSDRFSTRYLERTDPVRRSSRSTGLFERGSAPDRSTPQRIGGSSRSGGLNGMGGGSSRPSGSSRPR